MVKRGGPKPKVTGRGGPPTMAAMLQDDIMKLAEKYWLNGPNDKQNLKLVDTIFEQELRKTHYSTERIMFLEFTRYLENCLWPQFVGDECSVPHILSIAVMVNEKFREGVPPWECFQSKPECFEPFFLRILRILSDADEEGKKLIAFREKTQLLIFLSHCMASVEVAVVRDQIKHLVSLTSWHQLSTDQREKRFSELPKLRKLYNALMKKESKITDENDRARSVLRRDFLWNQLTMIGNLLAVLDDEMTISEDILRFVERFLEFLVCLESSLMTRRFFNAILNSSLILTKFDLSVLGKGTNKRSHLFRQLLEQLKFYHDFEMDESGLALSQNENAKRHYSAITSLQKATFKVDELETISRWLHLLPDPKPSKSKTSSTGGSGKENEEGGSEDAAADKSSSDDQEMDENEKYDKEFLLNALVTAYSCKESQLQLLLEMPLYPTEADIWNEDKVPSQFVNGEKCFAAPKLNLQFLTIQDYLYRNFALFLDEATYEIRQDVEDAAIRMKPWAHETNKDEVVFGGWARMALPITNFGIVEVSKPNIGENAPSSVRADISVTVGRRFDVRKEWESLRKHDVCFLMCLRPKLRVGTKFDVRKPIGEQLDIAYVRGCEVEGMIGPDGKVIEEFGVEAKPHLPGDSRTWRVWLDANQYLRDMQSNVKQGNEDVYDTFNVVIRRKPKENNFKSVLETIRQLMGTRCVVPDWLEQLILGYGSPDAANYKKMKNRIPTLDFKDTFLDYQHLMDSFPGATIECLPAGRSEDGDSEAEARPPPPYKLTFSSLQNGDGDAAQKPSTSGDGGGETAASESTPAAAGGDTIKVEPWTEPNRGPYPYDVPKRNAVRFTPTQIEAIKSGVEPGLTMVVGPPGSGKTDTACQIVQLLYHNFPEQRTLIVTHSNNALNQLFEKIMALDVDERHLLRLGHGEEALETEKDFSRYGRVNYVLQQRLELLKEVQRLQESLGVTGDVSYTCETSGHFYLYQVYARWETYESQLGKATEAGEVAQHFPFTKFFSNAPQPLFKGESLDEDREIARGCWRHIRRIFKQLEEFRAFELLRTGRERTEYLLVKEAKIIAMTCTHAALRRRDLVELSFHYDNIMMEESAQILEIETFIPLLLQNPKDGYNRLKRWIMIGDHHQLPPVVQNMAFQKYCNMEQSLFARFVRLGVPTVQLDAQGRARASLAQLYSWRYSKLDNLPHVSGREEFQRANAGFVYDCQLIDVGPFNGVGESTPSAHFYQNLGEAEYAVALFMYMRLLGYAADKISILTTYNGQKHLIRDVVRQRCESNKLFGTPHKIETVDKYQGQQNDFIILSLVRTNRVGHLRDVRRLVVALSRARLGLFVLARVKLFANCFELTPAFNLLRKRPTKLLLAPSERPPCKRLVGDLPPKEAVVEIDSMPMMAQFVYDFYTQSMSFIEQQMKEKRAAAEATAAEAKEKGEGAEVKDGENDPKKAKLDGEGDKKDADDKKDGGEEAAKTTTAAAAAAAPYAKKDGGGDSSGTIVEASRAVTGEDAERDGGERVGADIEFEEVNEDALRKD